MEIQVGLWCRNLSSETLGLIKPGCRLKSCLGREAGELPGRQGLIRDLFPQRDPHFLIYNMLLSSFSAGSC